MDNRTARQKVAALRRQDDVIDSTELDEVWAALPTVHVDDIIGEWRGVALDTGHRAVTALREIRWYGTRFHSQMDAHPLIRYDPDGHLYSDADYAYGTASLWMVEFRGELTAAMVFDGVPVLDHFKKVDETTLLGIMNGKRIPSLTDQPFYFLLDRADRARCDERSRKSPIR